MEDYAKVLVDVNCEVCKKIHNEMRLTLTEEQLNSGDLNVI